MVAAGIIAAPEPAAEASPAAPDTAPAAVPPSDTPVTEAAPAAPAAPVGQPAAPDSRVAALMAREADLLNQRQAFEAEKAAIRQQIQAELQTEAARQLKLNPIDFIKRLSPDRPPHELAEDLWYGSYPEHAPPEYKAKQAQRTVSVYQTEKERVQAELEQMTKRQSETKAQQEAMEQERAYVAGLQSYVSAVPDSYSRTKHLAAQKPDKAVELMYDAAVRFASQHNRVPTTEEATQVVEQYLDGIGYTVPVATPPIATTPAAPTVSAPAMSLRNSNSAAQPALAPVDPNDPAVLRRRALEAAGLPTDLFDR